MFDCERYSNHKDSPIPQPIVNEEQKLVILMFPDDSSIQISYSVESYAYIAPDGSGLYCRALHQQQQQRQISQQTQQQEFLEGEIADRKKRLLEQQQRQDKIRNNTDQQEADHP
jgi:hypothetical protein